MADPGVIPFAPATQYHRGECPVRVMGYSFAFALPRDERSLLRTVGLSVTNPRASVCFSCQIFLRSHILLHLITKSRTLDVPASQAASARYIHHPLATATGAVLPAGIVSCGFLECLLGRLRPDCEHDSPVDLPSLEALENVVDRFQRLRLDDCLHLAVSGKAQSLFQIEPRAHNRAPDGIAVQHYIENRDRKFSRRQTVEHTGAGAPQHADCLLESYRRHGRYQNSVRPANLFLNLGGRILCLGINC